MSCSEVQAQLRTLPTRAFETLPHLRSCTDCRTVADAIRDQEALMYATVDRWVQAPSHPSVPAPVWPWMARARRVAQAAVLLFAVAATLWLAVRGGAPEAPVDGPERSGALPAVPEGAPLLEVNVGTGLVVELGRTITRVEVDEAVATTRWLGDDHLLVHVVGVAEGQTTLTLHTGPGSAHRYRVRVGPSLTRPLPEDRGDALILELGADTTVRARAAPRAISSSSPGVVAARPQAGSETRITLSATGLGVADVVFAYADGPPDVYVVVVPP